MIHKLRTPLNDVDLDVLEAGDEVLINGSLIVARDMAHKKMIDGLHRGHPLPFDPVGQIIYYMGPSPTPPGATIGAAGPTTSGRMDAMTPSLLDLGVKGLLGKGRRGPAVKESLLKNKAVYLAAVGGGGALLNRHILKAEVVCWPELGPEALMRLKVFDFPATVIIDLQGRDFYDLGPSNWLSGQLRA